MNIITGEMKELSERRTRVQDGYEKGLYSPTEASRRLVAIENDIKPRSNQNRAHYEPKSRQGRMAETHGRIAGHHP